MRRGPARRGAGSTHPPGSVAPVATWWREDIVEPGKLPLLLLTVTFVVTFVATRVIVRAIRAGKGPFSDNTVGGVHVHHVVPGIVLVVLGGLVAFGAQSDGWRAAAAVAFGIGLALVLDEFALILHLEDVYWEQEGRLSVDVVFVLAAVLVLSLVVGSPVGIDEQTDQEVASRIGAMVGIVITLGCAGIAVLKGKFASAVIGVVFPLVAVVAAVRLARPRSPWATRRYAVGSTKQVSAQEARGALPSPLAVEGGAVAGRGGRYGRAPGLRGRGVALRCRTPSVGWERGRDQGVDGGRRGRHGVGTGAAPRACTG